MRSALLICNAFVLTAIAWISFVGPSTPSKSLLPNAKASKTAVATNLSSLEERAALAPSVETVTSLASAYVDHGQPGLACAVIERSDRSIQTDLAVADVHARALFHRGQPRQALAVVEDALAACESDDTQCRNWQTTKARGQAAFLHEVVVAGIEDPMTDPSALRAAYERSTKKVGLVAMR
ncbi:MAG TPA: hypothetical protein PK156_33355 [Polyangium sp.]|nr:hypothetical protein [Polyangium sp.]